MQRAVGRAGVIAINCILLSAGYEYMRMFLRRQTVDSVLKAQHTFWLLISITTPLEPSGPPSRVDCSSKSAHKGSSAYLNEWGQAVGVRSRRREEVQEKKRQQAKRCDLFALLNRARTRSGSCSWMQWNNTSTPCHYLGSKNGSFCFVLRKTVPHMEETMNDTVETG